MHMGGNGRFLNAHDFCGFGMAQLFSIDQQNRVALFLGETTHRRPHFLRGHKGFLLGRVFVCRNFGIGLRVLPTRGPRTLKIANGIERYAICPTRKYAAPIKASNRLTDLHADVLRYIFGVISISAPPPRSAVDCIILLGYKRAKCLSITIARAYSERMAHRCSFWLWCGGQSHHLSMHIFTRTAIVPSKTSLEHHSLGACDKKVWNETMSEKKPLPFGLTSGRILILSLGAFLVIIAISMSMGGLHSYEALKEANNAAKHPTPEQLEAAQPQQ
jgi:hypothetical protein